VVPQTGVSLLYAIGPIIIEVVAAARLESLQECGSATNRGESQRAHSKQLAHFRDCSANLIHQAQRTPEKIRLAKIARLEREGH
jgi:hypothetical protein